MQIHFCTLIILPIFHSVLYLAGFHDLDIRWRSGKIMEQMKLTTAYQEVIERNILYRVLKKKKKKCNVKLFPQMATQLVLHWDQTDRHSSCKSKNSCIQNFCGSKRRRLGWGNGVNTFGIQFMYCFWFREGKRERLWYNANLIQCKNATQISTENGINASNEDLPTCIKQRKGFHSQSDQAIYIT